MAQRLATEYVGTCLVLSENEMPLLLQLFQNHRLSFKVKVLENGDQEIVFDNAPGADAPPVLKFRRKLDRFVFEGYCRLTDLQLANAMRKAISQFKGDAIVNRIYPFHTVEYRYRAGKVVRIAERTKRGERLVYEAKEPVEDWVGAWNSVSVEEQIRLARMEINELLDRRNRCTDAADLRAIDQRLASLSHQLFVWEA